MIALYQNRDIEPKDYSRIAKDTKLTYELVSEIVEKLLLGQDVQTAQYAEPIRSRVVKLLDNLTTAEDQESAENTEAIPDVEITPEAEVVTDEEPKAEYSPAQSESLVATNYAAHQLIGAMVSTEGNHFIIDEEGICTINKSNPPALTESYKVIGQVIQLHGLKDKLEDKTTWLLGSIINALEDFHGTEFDLSQMCESTSKSYNTMWTAAHVFKVFKHKRYDLSFTHHKEVCFAKIADDQKALILSKAETLGLAARECRSLSVIVRDRKDGSELVKSIKTTGQAKELIKQTKINKTQYLILNENKWTRMTMRDETIPIGTLVINLKKWTVRKQDGPEIQIPSAKKQ